MVEFHEAWVERRSEQSDIAARVAHAQFAVDEAYRDTERYREMAERDPLTGLWNRRRSDAEIAAVLAKGRPACIALVDLDHFKQINDTFSHAVGDDVLRHVADLLRMAFGQAGRQGGEEFIVVLPGGLEDGRMACERVRQRLEAHPWHTIAPGLRVTASIGVSPFLKGESAGTAISRADALLYAAKRGGRNRVEAG
jgi:diguanylate cyclase (GGDEF)-like protein